MSEFAGFDGVVAAILSAALASILTAVAMHIFELRRDKQRRKLKILGWLRWLEFYLDEVKSVYLDEVKSGKIPDEELLRGKLTWWADHAMQSCGDSLDVLSKNEQKEFIGLLKDTFKMSGIIPPEIAGPIHDKTKRLLNHLEKKWKTLS